MKADHKESVAAEAHREVAGLRIFRDVICPGTARSDVKIMQRLQPVPEGTFEIGFGGWDFVRENSRKRSDDRAAHIDTAQELRQLSLKFEIV